MKSSPRRHGPYADWKAPKWIVCCLILIGLMIFMAGCTYAPQHEGSNGHTSVLPAVVVCLLAACDTSFSDRAERAGDQADVSNAGGETVDQTATAVPTVSIPLTGAAPADVAERVDTYLHPEGGE